MMQGEIKTTKKISSAGKRSITVLFTVALATLYLPIKILSTFYLFLIFLTMVKLLSGPLSEYIANCLLVKRQLLIPF